MESLAGPGGPMFTNGDVFHVDSGHVNADDDNSGKAPKFPLATLDAAVGKCASSNGDIILLSPGHSETYSAAAALTLDVAGVTIVGMGLGNSRPTFTLDTATTTDINVTADDAAIYNCIFTLNYADVVEVFDLSAAGFVVKGCRFVQTAVNMNWVDIVVGSASANECDRLEFVDNVVIGIDTANSNVISLAEDTDGLVFTHNYVRMGVQNSHAIIGVASGKDVTNCDISYNHIYRLNTAGDLLIDSDTSANTGIIAHNRIGHADTSGEVLIDADGVRQFDNLGTATATASGYVLPAIDS